MKEIHRGNPSFYDKKPIVEIHCFTTETHGDGNPFYDANASFYYGGNPSWKPIIL